MITINIGYYYYIFKYSRDKKQFFCKEKCVSVIKKGSIVQTILSHIDVIIHHKEINEVNLFVRRSFSEHLHSWLSDSASRL